MPEDGTVDGAGVAPRPPVPAPLAIEAVGEPGPSPEALRQEEWASAFSLRRATHTEGGPVFGVGLGVLAEHGGVDSVDLDEAPLGGWRVG